MKRLFFCFGLLFSLSLFYANAGGLVTNGNQSASYIRMLARGASTSGDAVFYNPAGLMAFDQGFTVSLNGQMIWMNRTITNDLPTLNNGEFVGKLYVPVFPGIYAAYKTGNWAFSLGFNPPAGGGSVNFDKGLPMLEAPVSVLPGTLTRMGIPTSEYSVTAQMKGTSIVYGIQAGATYSINDMFGVFGGVRMLFANNTYEGYVQDIEINPTAPPYFNGSMVPAREFFDFMSKNVNPAFAPYVVATSDQALDVKQTGKGLTPILGVHFRHNSLNLAAKYEFNTKMTLKNDTEKNAMDMYPDGQELRSDVPALLSLAGSYGLIPALKLSLGYLHYFEPQATLESWNPATQTITDRQDFIDHGTNEYLAGLEWNVFGGLVLSAGCQYSDVGVSDEWQNDITHNLDNFTLGFGAAYRFSNNITVNVGGMHTWYDKASVKAESYTQTYARTSEAFAIGIDYSF